MLNLTRLNTTADLEIKLLDFKTYFNHHRTHSGRAGRPPEEAPPRPVASLQSYRWESHCRGLYQTPIAACFPSNLKYRPRCIAGVSFVALRCRSVEATGYGRSEDG